MPYKHFVEGVLVRRTGASMKTGIKWSIILLGSIISTGNGDSNERFHLDHRNGGYV